MTKTIAIILAAVLVVGGGVTVGVVVGNNNLPENVVKDAVLGLANFVERDEFKPIYQAITNGSIEMSQSYIRQDDTTTMFTNRAKLFFADDGIVLQDAEFEAYGIKGDLWLTEDFVYVKEENLLGGAYALEMGKLAEQFEKSIFAFGSQSKYAISDQDTHDDIVELLAYLDKLNTSKMEKELTKIAQNYLKELWEITCDEVDFEEEVKAVVIDGESVDARNIKITVDANDVCEILKAAIDFLKEDDQVVKFLDKYQDLFDITSIVDTDETPETDGNENTNKTLAETYSEMLNQLSKNYYATAAEIQEEWGDDKLVVDVSTPKMKSQLLKLNVNYANEDVLTLDFGGKTVTDADKITLVSQDVTHVYRVINGDQTFKISYTVDGTETFKFQLDKDAYTYEMYYAKSELYNTTVKGKVIDGADLKITVNEITTKEYKLWWEKYLETTVQMDLSFVLKNKDKLPTKPTDYKTLETLTEEDVENLFGGLMGTAE